MTQSTLNRLSLARIPGRRSALYAWYVREWPVLRADSINWTWLMSEITKRRLTDRCGRLPTLQTARQTWYRVNGEMKNRAFVPQRVSPIPAPLPPTSSQPSKFAPVKIKE